MLGIFLDIETTGCDPRRHVPIDIAFRIIELDGSRAHSCYSALLLPTEEEWERRDPSSMAVNGYEWELLQRSGKTAGGVAAEIRFLFSRAEVSRDSAVFICQNPSFDRPFFSLLVDPYTQEFLGWPYHWLDLASMYWSQQLNAWKQSGERIPPSCSFSKDRIAATYRLPPEQKPHHALSGVDHLIACYSAVVGTDLASLLLNDSAEKSLYR